VRFSLDGGDNIAEGVARAFTNDGRLLLHSSADVREAAFGLAVSWSVSCRSLEVLTLMDDGMFTVIELADRTNN
jgi:hypothetical protein